jgi:hypothetical protein
MPDNKLPEEPKQESSKKDAGEEEDKPIKTLDADDIAILNSYVSCMCM